MNKKKITQSIVMTFVFISGLITCSSEGSNNNVSLPFEKVFFDFTGGSIEIPVNSNSEWTIDNPVNWCTTSADRVKEMQLLHLQ